MCAKGGKPAWGGGGLADRIIRLVISHAVDIYLSDQTKVRLSAAFNMVDLGPERVRSAHCRHFSFRGCVGREMGV
jgi:hypothetical protein